MNGSIGRRLAALEAALAAVPVGAKPAPPARVAVQHALLRDGYVRLAWGLAAARWEREPGWHECTDADWSTAAQRLHPAAGLDRDTLAADYWNDAAAWVELWQRDHATDAATLALLGFGAAELLLLMEDGDDDRNPDPAP